MSIIHLNLKNPVRGYALLRGIEESDPVWRINAPDGFRVYIEDAILFSLNEDLEIGDPPVEDMEDAKAESSYVEIILNYLYEIESTNACNISEMLIHRPIIINPVNDEELERADFLINLDKYVTGLYHTGEHTATDWEVSVNEGMEYPDFTSYGDRTNLIEIITSDLEDSTNYYIRAKFHSNEMRSMWSNVVNVTSGFIRAFNVRTKALALFCTTDVSIYARLVGGVGSDHTLEWEQTGTNIPIEWNWGQYDSLVANYTVQTFEDVFFDLIVDKGTKYEQRFPLNVYRGGIEFPNMTYKHEVRKPSYTAVPTLHLVKDFIKDVETYTKDQDKMFLFWGNPYHYDMRLMKWDPIAYEWETILDSPDILHYRIYHGMYKVVIYNLPGKDIVESKVYELLNDRSFNINTFINRKNLIHDGTQIQNLIEVIFMNIYAYYEEQLNCSHKWRDSATINNLIEDFSEPFEIFEIQIGEEALSSSKIRDIASIQNIVVVLLESITIG